MSDSVAPIAQQPAPRPYRVRAGARNGLEHVRAETNGQDNYFVRPYEAQGRKYVIGLVADGCTGKQKGRKRKSSTEVGSALLVMFAFSEIRQMLALGMNPAEIPRALYPRCVSYIGSIARLTMVGSPEELASLIGNFFICTLLGFIMDDETLVEFASGDGFHTVNDRNEVFDCGNESLYMGYHHVDRASLVGDPILPTGFDHINVYRTADLSRYGIGSDGLVRGNKETGYFLDPDEINSMFNYYPKAPAGLQWWLTKRQTEDQAYEDDVTVISVDWRTEII